MCSSLRRLPANRRCRPPLSTAHSIVISLSKAFWKRPRAQPALSWIEVNQLLVFRGKFSVVSLTEEIIPKFLGTKKLFSCRNWTSWISVTKYKWCRLFHLLNVCVSGYLVEYPFYVHLKEMTRNFWMRLIWWLILKGVLLLYSAINHANFRQKEGTGSYSTSSSWWSVPWKESREIADRGKEDAMYASDFVQCLSL